MWKKLISDQGKAFALYVLLFLTASVTGSAQNNAAEQARQLFDAGRYEEAIPLYRELCRANPANADFNYYLGASLAETNQLTQESMQALDKAKKEIPEAWFYLGKYFHVRSDWKNALLNYERFKSQARKKSVEASSVDKLIFMCRNMQNPFPAPDSLPEESTPATPVQKTAPAMPEPEVQRIPGSLKDSLIHFQVNAVVSYNKIDQFRNPSSKEAFVQGWLLEQELQRKMTRLNSLRGNYGAVVGPEKDSLTAKILKLEQETYRMNQQARDAFQKASVKEAAFWNQAGALEVEKFRKEVSRIQDSVRTAAEERKHREAEEKLVILHDTAAALTDTVAVVPAAKATGNDTAPAQTDASADVIFKIQIGAYRNSPPEWVQKQFKKLGVIRRIDTHVDEKGVTVYTVGQLKTYEDAGQMQKQIKMEGMKNAFVAAYRGNKRISLEEAKKLTAK
ncbi:MAG: tetratricopeptide repeat protein [Mangrovibacterium sp.]